MKNERRYLVFGLSFRSPVARYWLMPVQMYFDVSVEDCVLAATDERLEGNGGKLRVLHPNAAVREVLDMTGFSDILTIG